VTFRHWLIVGGVSVTAALVGLYFLATKPVEREYQTEPTGEAATNRFLAAERFYRKMGVGASTVDSLSAPPEMPLEDQSADELGAETSDVVVFSEFDFDHHGDRREAWQAWLRAGGHLIIPAPAANDIESARDWLAGWGVNPDRISETTDATNSSAVGSDAPQTDQPADVGTRPPDAQGVRSDTPSDPDAGHTDAGGPDSSTAAEDPRHEVAGQPDATYDTTAYPGSVTRKSTVADISLTADWVAARSNHSVLAAHLTIPGNTPRGNGGVTLLTGTNWLENNTLGNNDHPRLAWDLVARDSLRQPRHVTLVRHGARRWWFAHVAYALWPALATLGFLVIAAARQGGLRFGPPISDQRTSRRSRLEHIKATGRFLWRQENRRALVEPVRRALIRTFASGRAAHHTDTDNEQIAEHIADLLDVSPEQVTAWLDEPPDNRQDFIELIRILEQSRRQA
jgi:hypothetical protein